MIEQQIINSTQNIYSHIGDKTSQYIYTNRLLYSFTGDEEYLDNVVRTTPQFQQLANLLPSKAGAYIYGAGNYGKIVHRLFNDEWVAFLDQNKSGTNYEHLPVISPEEADITKRVYISTKFCHREVLDRLIQLGFEKDNIINVGYVLEEMANRQYFDFDKLMPSADEVFVDVGGYDGLTSMQFKEWCGNKYKKIYCLEPDERNISRIYETLPDEDDRFSLISKGAWNENTELLFSSSGEMTSAIDENGDIRVPVCRLDDVLDDEVTFIKMDIEGAEYEALIGTERIIREQKPKLAISVYHKPEDVIILPQLLLDYNAEYRLFFRHYTFGYADTVMYAI